MIGENADGLNTVTEQVAPQKSAISIALESCQLFIRTMQIMLAELENVLTATIIEMLAIIFPASASGLANSKSVSSACKPPRSTSTNPAICPHLVVCQHMVV